MVAVVNGEPTDVRMARTTVTVDYRPRGPDRPPLRGEQAPPPPKKDEQQAAPKLAPPPAKEQVKGKAVRAYFVIDVVDGDENVAAMVTSQRTKNKLRDAGVEAQLVGTDSPSYSLYREYVDRAGGPPAVLWVTAERRVRKAQKIAGTDTIEALLKGAEQ